MDVYCVRLKENHSIISYEIEEKVEMLELKTPEERYPDVLPPESSYEAYYWGTQTECSVFMQKLGSDLRDLFECQRYK